MEWIEVKIKTASEAVELVTGLLMANNIPNVRIVDDEEVARFLLDHHLNWDYKDEASKPQEGAEVIFHVREDAVGREILARIEKDLYDLAENLIEIDFGDLNIKHGPVNDDDWLHEWKKTYKPFAIGEKVVVRPFWEEYVPVSDEIIFTIDPGAVFGTGLHATTQLCVLAMEKLPLEGKTVLDIGCGSGILSVIALLFGAKTATACDIDPGAVRSATENARLNDIDDSRFEVYIGDITVLEQKEYDIILANIVADVIIEIAPAVKNFMKEGSLFITSGIIDDREEEVKAALHKAGLQAKERLYKEGWVCLVS